MKCEEINFSNYRERLEKQKQYIKDATASFKTDLISKFAKKKAKLAKRLSDGDLQTRTNKEMSLIEEKVDKRKKRYNAILQKNETIYHNIDKRSQDKLNKKRAKETNLDEDVLTSKVNTRIAKSEKQSTRIFEIDLARGFIILGMIIDHFIGDFWFMFPSLFNYHGGSKNVGWLMNMYDFSLQYWGSDIRCNIRFFGLFLLLVLCGISCSFSKNNLKRGLIVFSVGAIFSIAINLFSIYTHSNEWTFFSTLSCIGACILIYSLIRLVTIKIYNLYERRLFAKKKFDKIALNDDGTLAPSHNVSFWKWISLTIFCVGLVIWLHFVFSDANMRGVDLINNWWRIINSDPTDAITSWVSLGSIASINASNWYKVVLGTSYYGADWMGLFPSLLFLFLGGFIGEAIYKNRKSVFTRMFHRSDKNIPDQAISLSYNLNKKLNNIFLPITFLGRKAIYCYIFHQPAIIVVVGIILIICGVPLIGF